MQKQVRAMLAAIAAMGLAAGPAAAQDVESFDPNEAYSTTQTSGEAPRDDVGSTDWAIDADLVDPSAANTATPAPVPVEQSGPAPVVSTTQPGFDEEFSDYSDYSSAQSGQQVPEWSDPDGAAVAAATENSTTYAEDDLIGAAEGVFGKGAKGLAGLIEDLLEEQGEPNGYIVGREAGGAFIFGARYGSGTLHHKVEGTRKVYWTGPSIGFDAGANAANSFVLVYNLYDSEELFARFPAGEGQAYFVGGLHVSYMRKGDKVLIPIRVGAGLRLGVNAGYMKFSKKQRWLPF
ncbi:MAG: DUF1134 domain-containing protein [Pseudomonadota bacterium]